ncbi:MAG: hypothetical protein OJF50_006215 [Nitrospira sp.]|nr:hypothetical protein [Nitrospira sp.]
MGGLFAFLLSPWFQYSSSLLYVCNQQSPRTTAKLTHRRLPQGWSIVPSHP